MEWQKELIKKIEMDNDEKHVGGVYDMATEMALGIETIMGHSFDDDKIDDVIDYIYGKIKYGKE